MSCRIALNRMFVRPVLFSASLLSMTLLPGCGGEVVPKTVPVSGTVMYKGNPLEGATVSFWAEGAPRPATGVTNAHGEFKLSMFKANDGAIVGDNKITVVKMTPGAAPAKAMTPDEMLKNPTSMTSAMRGGDGPGGGGPKSEIPEKYANNMHTPLRETVTEAGPNQFVLQLTD
jgi:hypothetical protein